MNESKESLAIPLYVTVPWGFSPVGDDDFSIYYEAPPRMLGIKGPHVELARAHTAEVAALIVVQHNNYIHHERDKGPTAPQ